MNPDHEFESEERKLRELKPAQPSTRLRRRLESTVSYPPLANLPEPDAVHNVVRPPQSFWARPWFQTAAAALVGAAAAFALFKLNPDSPGTPDPGLVKNPGTEPIDPTFPPGSIRPEGFQLASKENRVFNAQDEGIVLRDKRPFRRVRYNTVDRRIFRDPETGAIFELVVPREDILIVPAETF